ncbi:hypothetical protein CYMTET_28072 [Cymbomonas tetramitiformis]|uniref:Uncharacterized protein n=1 Tax=Cymbomonas tetramitiformis TaxID=36881 RepID=A0AAE0FQ28_9CHLO|nr:hypothetical protein CYMTET_28072 [Cymbomonas tetramitiformis]
MEAGGLRDARPGCVECREVGGIGGEKGDVSEGRWGGARKGGGGLSLTGSRALMRLDTLPGTPLLMRAEGALQTAQHQVHGAGQRMDALAHLGRESPGVEAVEVASSGSGRIPHERDAQDIWRMGSGALIHAWSCARAPSTGRSWVELTELGQPTGGRREPLRCFVTVSGAAYEATWRQRGDAPRHHVEEAKLLIRPSPRSRWMNGTGPRPTPQAAAQDGRGKVKGKGQGRRATEETSTDPGLAASLEGLARSVRMSAENRRNMLQLVQQNLAQNGVQVTPQGADSQPSHCSLRPIYKTHHSSPPPGKPAALLGAYGTTSATPSVRAASSTACDMTLEDAPAERHDGRRHTPRAFQVPDLVTDKWRLGLHFPSASLAIASSPNEQEAQELQNREVSGWGSRECWALRGYLGLPGARGGVPQSQPMCKRVVGDSGASLQAYERAVWSTTKSAAGSTDARRYPRQGSTIIFPSGAASCDII